MGFRFHRGRVVDGQHHHTGDIPQLSAASLPEGGGTIIGGMPEYSFAFSKIEVAPVSASHSNAGITMPTDSVNAHT